ncbi:MAG: pyridoxal phosphate-dependent aminotransferase [archaeon]
MKVHKDLSKRTERIEGSPIRRIARLLEEAGEEESIISFGGGAPSLAPPQESMNYLAEKLKKEPQESTSYCSTPGTLKTRKLITDIIKEEENIEINPKTEITLTHGGTQGLYATLQTLINPGQEVIIQDPEYVGYPHPIKLAGGKIKRLKTTWQEDFQMTPEKVNEAITKDTEVIMTISPDNPTGRMLTDENLKGIVEIVEDEDLWLITDDIYKDIIYENAEFINSRKYGARENTITCNSFSKTASIPGMRIGYTYGPEHFIKNMTQLLQYEALCISRIPQIFLQHFLREKGKYKREYIEEKVLPTYKHRKNIMKKELKEKLPEAGFTEPEGAFYFFVDLSKYMEGFKDEEELSDSLYKEEEVVVIPGGYFGKEGKNHVRFTFVSESGERIKEGMERIKNLLD